MIQWISSTCANSAKAKVLQCYKKIIGSASYIVIPADGDRWLLRRLYNQLFKNANLWVTESFSQSIRSKTLIHVETKQVNTFISESKSFSHFVQYTDSLKNETGDLIWIICSNDSFKDDYSFWNAMLLLGDMQRFILLLLRKISVSIAILSV